MNLIEQPEKISRHCLVSGVMLKDAKLRVSQMRLHAHGKWVILIQITESY